MGNRFQYNIYESDNGVIAHSMYLTTKADVDASWFDLVNVSLGEGFFK